MKASEEVARDEPWDREEELFLDLHKNGKRTDLET